jgi:RNA recognition motif-containing protein
MISVFKIDEDNILEEGALAPPTPVNRPTAMELQSPAFDSNRKNYSWDAKMRVCQLLPSTTEEQLRSAFKNYRLKDVMIFRSNPDNIFASVVFDNRDMMSRALNEQVTIDGQRLGTYG